MSILKQFFGDALDGTITVLYQEIKNREEREKVRLEEERRKKLQEGSIDVEFTVKTETKQIEGEIK